MNFQSVDPAGLKDWALEKEGIPGFTIEIGGEDNQVDAEEFRKLWEENRYVILETAVAAADEIGVTTDVGSVYTSDFF